MKTLVLNNCQNDFIKTDDEKIKALGILDEVTNLAKDENYLIVINLEGDSDIFSGFDNLFKVIPPERIAKTRFNSKDELIKYVTAKAITLQSEAGDSDENTNIRILGFGNLEKFN